MLNFIIFGVGFFSITIVAASSLSDSEILAFDAPRDIQTGFPYYLSGYDFDGAPIWVFEAGKWDSRKYTELGGELFEAMDIHIDQMFLHFRDSGLNSTGKQVVIICDIDHFDIRQAGHFKTVQFIVSKIEKFGKIAGIGVLKQAWIINSNALFEVVWRLASPLLGNLNNFMEVFGTNKEKWKPRLLKYLPRDQIPEWYGGLPNHRPLAVFG